MSARLVLASSSPRRTELLARWGLAHEVAPADVDEHLDPDLDAPELTRRLALAKALAASRAHPRSGDPELVFLGADTVVTRDGLHLGKPVDAVDAARMLRGLSGRIVEVATGVALVRGDETLADAAVSRVHMRPFDDAEIAAYVAGGEPLGKAGAFAIQGEGGALVARCEGSFSNVVGLPRSLTLALLERFGVRPR
ncbi:MAG: Maf family protein [Planctomycetota bacterium]